jgi:4-amino-4-deoxy-L-arabinose transferase-like glycosyltransferase
VNGRRALWLVALAALALRLVLLVARGDYIVYDEGYYLLLARSLRAGQGFALNGLPHVALSPLQPVLVALASAVGVPDLWASRLLAALCGSLLVLPVANLAGRAGGPRAALAAAVFTAASPALMSFVPFFPGESWNLYFGSEPLFLLLAFSAVAAAVRAEEAGWKWWAAAGALAGASYLARAEGLVLCGMLLLVVSLRVVVRRAPAPAWRGVVLAAGTALVVAAPYLGYLHSALGRWAVSGRVQAASHAGAATPSIVESARSGGSTLDAFVWQGRPEAFVQAMYGLDPTGTRMVSQYWGIRAAPVPPAPGASTAAPVAAAPATADSSARPAPSARSAGRVWWQGITAVVPWWLVTLALVGLALGTRGILVWIIPLAASALLPSLLTYVEPRSLLPLAPLAALYAAVAVLKACDRLTGAWKLRASILLPAAVALALVVPAARDLVRAWPQTTALQQVATARRTVGEYLARHLPEGAVVMSFHPAVAIWADRSWRVLPSDSFQRIAAYAEVEHAAAVVFSRFEPSPIQRPPRAFTIILMAGGAASAPTVQLEPVDETPLLFVGRLGNGASR